MISLRDKTVLLLGGTGFFGKHINKVLVDRKAIVAQCGKHNGNLLDVEETNKLFSETKPDYLINCAGFNGGIIYNRLYPAEIFYRNTLINLNVLSAAHRFKVKKTLSIATSCSYPDIGKELLVEDQFYDGLPNESIQCHGLAKRNGEAFSRFLNKQYSFAAYTVIVTNLFGPYDTFNLQRSKVVSGLIRKFVEAQQEKHNSVECLGTGKARREFMWAPLAAEMVVQTLEIYENPNLPLNIGTGEDISIKALANLIKVHTKYEGVIDWKVSAGDGQIKKLLDVSRMKNILDYKPVNFEDCLVKTIEWYKNNQTLANEGR